MQVTQSKDSTLPFELGQEDKNHRMWALFALFVAIAPFIVILIPKIAGPVVLFGAVIFCAVFLLKDQKSNLYKNALELWENKDNSRNCDLVLAREEENQKKAVFFFQITEKPAQFECTNFIVSLASEGGREFLDKNTRENPRQSLKNVSLIQKDDLDELILVVVDNHRFWCRPWNYQLDFNEQLELFKNAETETK